MGKGQEADTGWGGDLLRMKCGGIRHTIMTNNDGDSNIDDEEIWGNSTTAVMMNKLLPWPPWVWDDLLSYSFDKLTRKALPQDARLFYADLGPRSDLNLNHNGGL